MINLRPWAPVVMVASLAACDDVKRASEQSAADELARLAPVLKEDVVQVRRGLPVGATRLGAMLDADTLINPPALQRAVATARAQVRNLELAKSTFFSVTDGHGVVLRSEADPDLLVGKLVTDAFPPLKKAFEPSAGVVEAFGEMKEMRAVRTGPDYAWVAAALVKDSAGATKGLFVTGWSFRALAYHLETTAKRQVTEASEKAGKKHAPIIYVYVVKGKTAYGAPTAPEVNAQEIEKLDVVSKAAGGVFRQGLEITNRPFGVAASKVPELGDDCALVVLASDF